MKVSYNHLIEYIESKPSINQISEKLFQLGHEHDIENNIFDIEFTPNRGDCLSVLGLLRDLAAFYDIDQNIKKYEQTIKKFNLDFINKAKEDCPNISFLKIEIEDSISEYKGPLNSYFSELNLNKKNFFTDISNYILYETGQPTHCYDAKKINKTLILDYIDENLEFETLLDKKILLQDKNLVFLQGEEIINLAGIVGGKTTSCSSKTNSVIVECAYFNPEIIIGKSIKYDISSDAAYRFEREVDIKNQEGVLRRFIQIVEDHAKIINLEIYSEQFSNIRQTKIPFNLNIINNIIGINLSEDECKNYLLKLGFCIEKNNICIPHHRNDISTQNDIAEEIARSIGYDNIAPVDINIPIRDRSYSPNNVKSIKSFLIKNGFNEIINSPFVDSASEGVISIDNPLDSNKSFLRTNLQKSLVDNLLYNERRQKDCIKLFEISDLYSISGSKIIKRKKLGLIASGRVDKNYEDFSKKINKAYILSIFQKVIPEDQINIEIISRDKLDTKLKNEIVYFEVDIENIKLDDNFDTIIQTDFSKSIKYKQISDYPTSTRDLSFSVKDYPKSKILEKTIQDFKHNLLKETFIFDYYKNEKKEEIKIGFRFIFQSNDKTIKDEEVDKVINDIIITTMNIDSVSIPGI